MRRRCGGVGSIFASPRGDTPLVIDAWEFDSMSRSRGALRPGFALVWHPSNRKGAGKTGHRLAPEKPLCMSAW